MPVALPQLRVGEPVGHGSLQVFPLFASAAGTVEYRLADEALADQSLTVEEVSTGGSVPELMVENRGDVRVLFLEGEQLIGAKQNRILNTSVLVAAHSKLKVPVSCVEQGRWHYNSPVFGFSGTHAPSKVRRALKGSVSASLKAKQGYRSDQGQVWSEVACLQKSAGVSSHTAALSDVFDSFQEQIASYRVHAKSVDGAAGLAVAVGDRLVSVDVFDKPATCEKVWNRLLTGVALDALETPGSDHPPVVADVEQLLASTGDLTWEAAEAVGEGQEFRAQSRRGDQASALAWDETIVHGSLVAAEYTGKMRGQRPESAEYG